MATRNRKVRWIGGISVTTVIAIIMAYVALSDRAQSSGAEKATVKKDVEAVIGRVDKLEKSDESTHKILHGEGLEDGLVSTVGKIKNDIGYMKEDISEIKGSMKDIGKQNVAILEELRKLK